MKLRSIEEYKKTLRLSKRQRAILVGLLLGDGHLETQTRGNTFRLKVEHSIKQKQYVDWLYREFSAWIRGMPRAREKFSLGQMRESYGFTTYASGALRFYGQQFYSEKQKVVPKLVHKLLEPISLAIWFMDDGSWKSNRHRTYIIHTVGYRKAEVVLLQQALWKKFGIAVSMHKQFRPEYRRWRLYVLSNSAAKFKQLIEPYIIPEMRYKLGEHYA